MSSYPDKFYCQNNREARKAFITQAYPKGLLLFNDVKALTAKSKLVVLGSPVFTKHRIEANNQSDIWTEYRIKVDETFKSEIGAGKYISLRVDGGKVKMPDGSTRELRFPNFWRRPVKGHQYIFFLNHDPRDTRYYALVGGPQGLFYIKPDGKSGPEIYPQVRMTDQLMKNYRHMPFNQFRQEIIKEVGRP
jgi:hypothetical protein